MEYVNIGLERRIKQHVIAKAHVFFAVIQPGFETTAKKELESLFARYGIERGVDDFRSIVPKVYGRHEYKLFLPGHKKGEQTR